MKYFSRFSALALSSFLLTACTLGPVLLPQASNLLRVQNQDSHQVVQLRFKQPQELWELSAQGFDLFGVDGNQGIAKARITPNQSEILKTKKIAFEVIFEPQMEQRGGLPAGYMSYVQMTQKLRLFAEQFPHLITLEDVGDTWQKLQGQAPNHDIWSVSLTNKQSQQPKPTVLFVGGVHARELAPVELLLKLLDLLTSQYGKDPRITQLLDTREIVFVPMVNVDGRVEVEKGDSWKRKNMNTSRGDGVDLNRNYDYHWNYEGLNVPSSWKQGLSTPSSQIYSGSGPASEPETQAVQAVFQRKSPKIAADVHAYGEMMLWPFGYLTTDLPATPKFRRIYDETVAKLKYKGGTSAQILYPTTATTRDYAYGRHGSYSMTLEVGQSFRPSYGELENMWQNLQPNFLRLIELSAEID